MNNIGAFSSVEYYNLISPEDHINNNHGRFWESANMIAQELRKDSALKRNVLVELGCAAGQSLERFIMAAPFKKYIVVDVSEKMAQFTEQKYKKKGHAIKGLAANLEYEKVDAKNASANAVVASGTVYFLKNCENLFQEAHRLLQRKGIFIFDVLISKDPEFKNGYSYPNINHTTCYTHGIDVIDSLASKHSFTLKGTRMIEEGEIFGERIADHVLLIFSKK